VNNRLDARLHFVLLGAATLKGMKNLAKYLMIALVLGFGLAACEPNEAENAVEDTGAAVEGAAEDAGETLDDAAEGTEDAASDAVEEVEDETDGN